MFSAGPISLACHFRFISLTFPEPGKIGADFQRMGWWGVGGRQAGACQ